MNEQEAVTEAVRDTFGFWLSQHPITVGDCIQDAAREAMSVFLVRNREDIIERVAQKLIVERK